MSAENTTNESSMAASSSSNTVTQHESNSNCGVLIDGECEICFEDYTINNKNVKCPKCDHSACQDCWKTQFTKYQGQQPYCTNDKCAYEFSIEFLYRNFPRSFIMGELKEHQAKEYLSIEKEKIRKLIPIVRKSNLIDMINENTQFLSEKKKRLYHEINSIQNQLDRYESDIHYLNPNNGIIYPDEILDEYIANGGDVIKKHYRQQTSSRGTKKEENKPKVPVYNFKCPDNSCKGYLDSRFKCGICSKYYCNECSELLGNIGEGVRLKDLKEEHVCKEEDKASFAMIKESTRPCPKCKTRIFKSSGCRQMWCTVCHTTFDYYTGKIETGMIHNPHYFEYMQGRKKQEEEPRDVEMCHGEIVEWTSIQGRFDRNKPTKPDKEVFEIIKRYNQLLLEIDQYVMGHYIVRPERVKKCNDELCLKFMTDQITEEEWKQKLMTHKRVFDKNRRIWEIFDLFKTAGADIINSFYQIIDKDYSSDVLQKTVDQLNELVKYCNNTLSGSIESMCLKAHPIFHISDYNYVTLYSSVNHPSYISNRRKTKGFKESRNNNRRGYHGRGTFYSTTQHSNL